MFFNSIILYQQNTIISHASLSFPPHPSILVLNRLWNSPICYFCLTCMLLILHSGCWYSFEKQRQGLEAWIYLSTNKLSVKSLVYTDFNRSWQDLLVLLNGIFFFSISYKAWIKNKKDYLALHVSHHEIIMNWQQNSDAINGVFLPLCEYWWNKQQQSKLFNFILI